MQKQSAVKQSTVQQSTVQPLTPKEKAVLEFVEQFIMENGVSPSFGEIKEYFGFASYNSVQNYLKQLTSKGYLHAPGENQKRALQVLHPINKKAPEVPRSEMTLALPLLGKVAAGKPIEASMHDEFIDVPRGLVKNPGQTFALRVQGESMIEDGILHEDIILVQKQSQARDGQTVVAIVNNEATVKKFYKQKDKIELRPANATMSSMWFSAKDALEIRGILVGLVRKY